MRFATLVALSIALAGCSSLEETGDLPPTNTAPPYALLAEEVLKNTPEHLHFSPGAIFSWCYFETPEPDPIPSLTEAVLTKLRAKYTVYLAESEIPPSYKVERDGRFVGYRRGFHFRLRTEVLDERTVKIHYYDFEADLAASFHFEVYKWTGSAWKVVEKSPLAVS